jgi:hypothetical protein
MKKRPDDELREEPREEPRHEYDFRLAIRGRHHRKLATEGTVVRLDPDVASRFPTSKAVNEALRRRPGQ